jgi:uncharacterized protein (DUF433 family)
VGPVVADVVRNHIEVVEGPNGPKARIVGSRIRVQDVVIWHEKLGMSPDEIVHQYPTITLADVHAALAYYWDHRDDIERTIADEDAFVEEFRRGYVSPLEERLKRRGFG